jgi:hypothetical protein
VAAARPRTVRFHDELRAVVRGILNAG